MALAVSAGGNEIVVWRATVSALCAGLIGIGFARFAYSPLIPALIAEQWFTPAEAAYIGAANLAGYLAGALIAGRMTKVGSATVVLQAMMLLATASFFACAYPLPFAWFFGWRFAAGLAGGVLMVLAALAVLPHVAPSQRGRIGGAIFTGIGLGVAASGTIVPVLMRFGLSETWNAFGLISAVLTVVAWTGWPRQSADGDAAANAKPAADARTCAAGGELVPASRENALRVLYVEYALNAVGLVPHMVFLVDFVARGLGRGLDVGGFYWVVFGLGATAGPLLAGALADRIGFQRTLRISFLIQAAAVALIAVTDRQIALLVSSAIVGMFVPGVVPLVLGRMHELVHDSSKRQAAWSWCTTAFAVGQASAAYGFSYLFARMGGAYELLFGLGATALLTAFILDVVQGRDPPTHSAKKRKQ